MLARQASLTNTVTTILKKAPHGAFFLCPCGAFENEIYRMAIEVSSLQSIINEC
jgi:hypothetical protein